MRFIRCAVAAALAITATSSVARAQAAASSTPFKIAYINSEVLLNVAPGRAAAESTFNAEAAGYRAQIQAMSDSLGKVVAAYQKREATLTAAQKATQQKSIQDLQSEFENKSQQIQQTANQRQNEIMSPVMEVVKKVIDDIRVEDGYAMVLDNAPGGSPIVSADKNLDITDRVIARLRSTKAPALPTATPSKPAAGGPVGVTRKPPTQ
jgi:outer membrane protein